MKTQTLDELMGKITPLPWRVSRNANGEYSEIHSGYGGMIADFATVRKPKENDANTAFAIHAANNFPKLVEAATAMTMRELPYDEFVKRFGFSQEYAESQLERALAAANEIKE